MSDSDASRARDDDLDGLVAHVGDPRRWTWVLDFDGTLAPIVDHPDDAVLAFGAWDAVADLASICTVALLSGRALADLERRLGTVPPRVLLVGGHGSEARLPDGTRTPLTDLDAASEVLDEVVAHLDDLLDGQDGWLVERKSTSVAVHHRQVADHAAEALLPRVREVFAAGIDRGPGFVVLAGKAVLELKVQGVDKGRAVAWIDGVVADQGRRPSGGRPTRPIVLGDDVTDEDGFAAADALGGAGVLVSDLPADTAAQFRLRDPDRVVAFLRTIRGPRADAGTADRS